MTNKQLWPWVTHIFLNTPHRHPVLTSDVVFYSRSIKLMTAALILFREIQKDFFHFFEI